MQKIFFFFKHSRLRPDNKTISSQLKIIVVSRLNSGRSRQLWVRQSSRYCRVSGQIILPPITGDFKHPIVCDFPAGLASEFSRESQKKKQGCCIVFDYSVATIDCAPFNSSDIYLFINIYTCIDGELAR